MSCACGSPTSIPAGGSATCGDCGRQNLSCPQCGAAISAAAEAVVLACPYCETPLQHADTSGAPPYFPVSLSQPEAEQVLLRFLLNRFGIPGDMARRYRVEECKQIYLPVHLFTVNARLTASISEADTTAVMCNRSPWYLSALARHRFAARAKLLMDPDKVKAKVYPVQLTKDKVLKQVDAFGKTLLARDRKRFSGVAEDTRVTHEDHGQVFYPFYELTYRYGRRTYRGALDASSGVVCQAEHPMSLRTRAVVMAAGGVMLAFTGCCALLFVLLAVAAEDPVFVLSALLSLVAGLPATARIFWAATRSHKGAEDLDVREQHLDLSDLSVTIPVTERKAL